MLAGSSLGNLAERALGTRNPCHRQYTSNSHLPIGAKFLKQQSAQNKFVDPSVGSSKRTRVQSTTRDVPHEDMHEDPIVAVAKDGDDEVDVDTATAAHTFPPLPSLHAMMEAIMTTQAAYGQLLYGFFVEVTV